MSIQLKQQLLDHSNNDKALRVTKEWLCDLFHPDSIKNGDSIQLLRKIGGYQGLQKFLKTDQKKGIKADSSDLSWRSSSFGTNAPITKPPKTFLDMVLQNFNDSTIQILCAAAILSLVLGCITHGIKKGWLEGASIILAVIIISAVTSINNYMKQQQFRKLNEVAKRKNINVTRNNEVVNMSVYELMVGDVVQVETGQIVSVDGIVFKASNLSTDESSVTGQSDAVKKQDFKIGQKTNPFLISGSKVMQGTCMMIVLAIGEYSREGISRKLLQEQDQDTPLQEKLTVLADQIGHIGMISAGLTFIALFIHFIIDVNKLDLCVFCYDSANILVGYFIIAVSIIVIAVPQGLPLAVTISLAYSVGKMKDQNNLVRFLNACQTMGGANNICTDKTGTLTKNQMTVTRLYSEGHVFQKFTKKLIVKEKTTQLLCNGVCINSNAVPQIQQSGKFIQNGNKTQCALLEMAYNMGYDFRKIRKNADDGHKIKKIIPFSSARKKMSTCCQMPDGKIILFSKGAPDFLLANTQYYIEQSGQIKHMTEDYKAAVKFNLKQFAASSLRTILLCYKQIKEQQLNGTDEQLQSSLIVIGLVGIKDPLKDQIPDAVNKCKRAGITVRMVTGDITQTATAIAKDANLIPGYFQRPSSKQQPGYYVVMEGKQFRQTIGGLVTVDQDGKGKKKQVVKNLDQFRKIVKELRVLARSSPQDKYLLATGLKQLDNVVAMTGDGTNDAPALKKADIGFAMGLAGTQVAKQAAGIILLDDNFSSIITAVKYGRNIFDCIRKFLQFQLTVNVVAIFMAFLGAVFLKQSPLTPVQMLWVNLIMDTLAALALATQPPNQDLLLRMPYSRNEHIITALMWRSIAMHSIFQMVILLIVLFYGPQLFGVQSSIGLDMQHWNPANGQHLSIFFDVFVFLQVFNFFNARKLKKDQINVFTNILNNYLFILIVIGIFVCQIFIVQFGGQALKLVPLSMTQHLICIIIGFLSILNGIFVKTCIPDSLFNSITLFSDNKASQISDADSIFTKFMKHPAAVRRSSKHRH